MFLFQILAVIVVLFARFAFGEMEGSMVNIYCLVAILIFGIPHGAIDHKVHLSVAPKSSLATFIAKYLIVAAVYAGIWLIFPPAALILFLAISAYHFGQETLENYGVTGDRRGSILIGAFLVVGPIVYHYDEAFQFLDIIAKDFFPELGTTFQIIVELTVCLLAGAHLFALHVRGEINRRNVFKLFMFLVSIALLNVVFSFLVAFTIYFILFHSFNAFRHQYRWLENRVRNYNLKRFLKDLLGFSVLAISGLALTLWMLNINDTARLVSYFFMLTSIITLPHAITLDHFYKTKKKINARAVISS